MTNDDNSLIMPIIVVKLLNKEVSIITGLKELRRTKSMTQADLARMIGVTQSVVAQWERGATMPNAAKLPELASMLNCTIDDLFGRTPSGRDGA